MRRQIEDILYFFIGFLLIYIIWHIFLKWSPGYLIGNNDAPQFYLFLKQLLTQESISTQFNTYRIDLQGGSHPILTLGLYPFLKFFKLFQIDALSAYNFSVIMIQNLIVFYGKKITDCVQSNFINNAKFKFIIFISLIFFCAFNPIVGWRIYYGHLSLILGSLPIISIFAFAICSFQNKNTIFQLLLTCYTFYLAIVFITYQVLWYSVVFCSIPLLLYCIRESRKSLSYQTLFTVILIPISTLFISLPDFYPIFKYHTSAELARTLQDENFTFSYITLEIKDIVTSLFYSQDALGLSRVKKFLNHEANYPILIGTLLSLFLIQYKKIIWFLIFTLCWCILYSMNIPIIEDITSLIPLLKSFRVPMRTLIPLTLLLNILGVQQLLTFISYDELKKIKLIKLLLLSVSLVFLMFFIPIYTLDIVTIMFIFIMLLSKTKLQITSAQRNFLAITILFSISVLSIRGFQERSLPFVKISAINDTISKSKHLLEEKPNYLERYTSQIYSDIYRQNLLSAFNLSTIHGNEEPISYFNTNYLLFSSLSEDLKLTSFKFFPRIEGHLKMLEMYNTTKELVYTNGQISIKKINESNSFKVISKFKTYNGIEEYKKEMLLDNHLISNIYSKDLSGIDECMAEGISINTPSPSQIEIIKNIPAKCLIVLPTNYSHFLKPSDNNTKLLPINYSLLGVLLPVKSTNVIIQSKEITNTYVHLLRALGFIILGVILLREFKYLLKFNHLKEY